MTVLFINKTNPFAFVMLSFLLFIAQNGGGLKAAPVIY